MSLRASPYPLSALTSPPRGPLGRRSSASGARRVPVASGLAAALAFAWSLPVAAQEADAEEAAPAAAPAAPSGPKQKLLESDELEEAGYLPGYRHYSGLGLSP